MIDCGFEEIYKLESSCSEKDLENLKEILLKLGEEYDKKGKNYN